MTRRRRLALIAAAAVTLYTHDALAQPAPELDPIAELPGAEPDVPAPWHFKRSPVVISAGGVAMVLPPGYYLADDTFAKLDAELRRAQDAETRLTAENDSFRASARDGGLGWKSTASLCIAAFSAGIFVQRYAL